MDAAIPELRGTGRDAMALWLWFTDTIKEQAVRLWVNEQAMYAAASEAIFGKRPGSDGALQGCGVFWGRFLRPSLNEVSSRKAADFARAAGAFL